MQVKTVAAALELHPSHCGQAPRQSLELSVRTPPFTDGASQTPHNPDTPHRADHAISMADQAAERVPTPALGDADGWRAFGAAIAARAGTRDPLEIRSETVPRLSAGLRGQPLAELQCPEAPGRWSVAAVIEHLTDAELVFGFRVRQVLRQEAPPLASFDQEDWATVGRYAESEAHQAFALFAALRARHLALYGRLSAADWERVGVHGDRGAKSLRTMIRIIAGHDLAHCAQVERILKVPTDA